MAITIESAHDKSHTVKWILLEKIISVGIQKPELPPELLLSSRKNLKDGQLRKFYHALPSRRDLNRKASPAAE